MKKRDLSRREFLQTSAGAAAGMMTASILGCSGGSGSNSGSVAKTATVSIATVKNGRIDLAVEEAIELLGGINAVTTGKQKIMLKPNLTIDNTTATTNPEVISALAVLLQGAGKEVLIGEGSACATGYNLINGVVYWTNDQTMLDNMQQYIFDKLGYTALAQSLGIQLINLHSGDMSTVAVPNGFVFDNITINKTLTDIDMLCSVPMMKTDQLAGVSLGMKNLFGTYPGTVYGSVRSMVHDKAAAMDPTGTAAAIVDIVRANKLGLVVIDGTTAMEGNGPTSDDLLDMNLIIAGTDPLATDMVAAYVMGFMPTDIQTFQWANEAGMQTQNLSQIEILGETIASVQRNFVMPQRLTWNNVEGTFGAQEI